MYLLEHGNITNWS